MSPRSVASLFSALKQQFLLPILRMSDPQLCLEFCRILSQEGLGILEITLTTPDALSLLHTLSTEGILIGAGTVLTRPQAEAALDAGAVFLVSPGLNPEIAALAHERSVAYLPGVYTASEVMQALALGLTRLKFFPAKPAGPEYLKHLSGPFPEVQWLPTGGLELSEIPLWLKLPLAGIGQGSRLVSAQALHRRDWERVRQELKAIQTQRNHWQH